MSHVLTDEQNNRMNKVNSILEVGLTVSIFVSSFLVLTVEKDWWGGYLSAEKNSEEAQNFRDWLRFGKRLRRPNPSYVVENTIRLTIVGCSISFFLIMSCLEVLQSAIIGVNFVHQRAKHVFSRISSRKSPERLRSAKEIAYDSTIIISNVQMFVIMLTVACSAIVLGILQGSLDPESAHHGWSILNLMTKELEQAELSGIVIGAISGFCIEYIRQLEMKHRLPYKHPDEPHADSNNLNFDTDSEGDFSHCDFYGSRAPQGSKDDDEKVSLISFQPIPRAHGSTGFKIEKTKENEYFDPIKHITD